jgi:transcriptional repressor NrdR
MKCPFCQNLDTKVVDKRETEDSAATRRRRECLRCQKRFTTYERIDLANIYVVKKDGTKELFDPEKLERGILRSCVKRPITPEQIRKIVKDIEVVLRNRTSNTIPSKQIGTLVLTRLKKIDKVAYIRFASVYREFTDIEEFQSELNSIKED